METGRGNTGGQPSSIRRHRFLIALLGGYAAVVFPAALVYDRAPRDLKLATTTLLFTCLFAFLGLLIALLVAARADRVRPRAAMVAWWRRWWRAHGPGVVIALLALPVLMATFFTAKLLIPAIQPFVWDVRFAELDQMLHGAEPWRILHPLLGYPQVTNALSLLYSFWILLMFGAWVVWALVDHPERMRFLISYSLCWIVLGTVAATLFSSAGPVFYAEITGDATLYGDLMAYLRATDQEIPLFSVRIRDELWRAYLTGNGAGGTGISAMPSLHVAIVTLCALSSWYLSWRVGLAMTIYAAVIFAGSIHLGWHYAVDGYVSIIAVIAIWYAVGKALNPRGRAATTTVAAAATESSLARS